MPPIQVIQTKTFNRTTGGTAASVTLTNPVSAGNSIIVLIGTTDSAPNTVFDNQGSFYTNDLSESNFSTGFIQVWRAWNVAPGSYTINIGFGSATDCAIAVQEVKGLRNSLPFIDTSAIAASSGTFADTAAINLSTANELVYFLAGSGAGIGTDPGPSGFTPIFASFGSSDAFASCYQIYSIQASGVNPAWQLDSGPFAFIALTIAYFAAVPVVQPPVIGEVHAGPIRGAPWGHPPLELQNTFIVAPPPPPPRSQGEVHRGPSSGTPWQRHPPLELQSPSVTPASPPAPPIAPAQNLEVHRGPTSGTPWQRHPTLELQETFNFATSLTSANYLQEVRGGPLRVAPWIRDFVQPESFLSSVPIPIPTTLAQEEIRSGPLKGAPWGHPPLELQSPPNSPPVIPPVPPSPPPLPPLTSADTPLLPRRPKQPGDDQRTVRIFNQLSSIVNSLTQKGILRFLGVEQGWTIVVPATSGVTSFNGRMGAVTLTSGDVDSAFIPLPGNVVYASMLVTPNLGPVFRPLVTQDLPVTGVTPGTYTNATITVDLQGTLTFAASGSGGGAAPTEISINATGSSQGTAAPIVTAAQIVNVLVTPSALPNSGVSLPNLADAQFWVSNVGSALGPSTLVYPPSGGTLSGLTSKSIAGTNMAIFFSDTTGLTWYVMAGLSGTSVTSFNTRTGAVTLLSSDVFTALGFTVFQTVSADFLGLTAAKNPVVTVTSPNDGVNHQYSIGGYLDITAITLDVIQMVVSFTDENGTSRNLTLFPVGLTSASLSSTGYYLYPTVTISVDPNTSITLLTQLTTGTGSIGYDVGGSITQVN